MNKPTVREYGVFIGNLLVFISIFLPWYGLNIYGTERVYSGIHLASSTQSFGMLYLLPLLSGIIACGVILRWSNRKIAMPKKYPRLFAIALSVVMLAIIFVAMAIPLAAMPTPVQ